MKEHYNESKTKRIWFNRYERLWTLQNIDAEGNQIGNAEFTYHKIYAFNWLKE